MKTETTKKTTPKYAKNIDLLKTDSKEIGGFGIGVFKEGVQFWDENKCVAIPKNIFDHLINWYEEPQ